MLKKATIFLTMLIATCTLFAANSNDIKVLIKVSESKEVKLSYNDFDETVVVRIFDNSGNVVYKEVYNSKGTNRELYNYSVLEPGEYTLNIKTRSDEINRTIFLDDLYQISYKD